MAGVGPGAHHLKIATTGPVGTATIELDGARIENGLSGITLHMHVGDLNSATLELVAPTFEVDGEFQIHLPQETQDLLKRLGWLPPG